MASNTHRIVSFDTEVSPQNNSVSDIGAVDDAGRFFHSPSKKAFEEFLEGAEFVCGHNIIRHDLKFVGECLTSSSSAMVVVDTLPISPLLFPRKPYHALLKDDKLICDELNNPVNDARKAKELLDAEMAAWAKLPSELRAIFSALLAGQPDFCGFIKLANSTSDVTTSALASVDAGAIAKTIAGFFHRLICENAPLAEIATKNPVELAYALALIRCADPGSLTPPWVLMQHPRVEHVFRRLRATPCIAGCPYCREKLDPRLGLKKFFGFENFRSYAGEPLQENAARAAVEGKSVLAVFPTGGGKSVTFQVPALMAGEAEKALTVVISPLQSLMKDQVDNLEARGITQAVAISGLLDPIEHAKAIERVADGSACLLYIAPESLRSVTMEKLLLQRNIARFVIDEAHCFSSWGQDFRPDYLYVGDFIKNLRERKLSGATGGEPIPVSCFTATAKQRVIEDICAYFKEKLGLILDVFIARSQRENLHYVVLERTGDDEKFNTVRDLIEQHKCPTIVYVSRTRRASQIAGHLEQNGFAALAFHGKMDREEKTGNQNKFLSGEAQIMVATTAFGMGVDKKDVGLVIHYDISDSIENYVQEAGRAGRDENINAECYVLFNEDDLNKHFLLLNQTKLNLGEIDQVWRAIKTITKSRPSVQQSALEIAREAGWDDASGAEMETRILTAINALEQSGYLKRKQNSPRIYASSIRCHSMIEASQKIAASPRFASDAQRQNASRIMANLFSARSRKGSAQDGAESRVDYISDNLGIVREDVIRVIQILREENILDDQKDMSAHFARNESENTARRILREHIEIERFLQKHITKEGAVLNVKELNEKAEAAGCRACDTKKINTLLNYWDIKHLARRQWDGRHNARVTAVLPLDAFAATVEKRGEIARRIVEYLHEKMAATKDADAPSSPPPRSISVSFSILELVRAVAADSGLFAMKATAAEIEDALFYLSRIDAMKIEGGFMVVYNRLTIERKEHDPRVRYKKEDYQKLSDFYENRVQQIHIIGEYAKRMLEDYAGAVQFVDDYFRLNFSSFLAKYFSTDCRREMRRNITPKKYRQLFESLSETQRRVIDDKDSRVIVAAAGPGSGKTKLLVHKLAALLLMEDVKHEQLLMLTFSRAAATVFKTRLLELVGNAANFVEIKTFHSYCFDLLGRVGSLDKTNNIIRETVAKIRAGDVEQNRITKTVLVIDEAQDMSVDEFELVRILMERNEKNMRIIAVGDDDQNIYAFRGSDSKYFASLLNAEGAARYDLLTNYRARSNLVAFSNQFARTITGRMKRIPVSANDAQNGLITITRYSTPHLAEPLPQTILRAGLAGSTAILTRDNATAEIITGLLNHHNQPARLIQSNDGFSLADIDEVRFFTRQIAPFTSIPDDEWNAAKRLLQRMFPPTSRGLSVCRSLIRAFEAANTRSRYRTDFEIFVRESRLEDFCEAESRETITVSTMHKAKGREFDNVFLLLTKPPRDDDERRLLYVALTRARSRLTILTNTGTFDPIQADAIHRDTDTNAWGEPSEITIFLTHKDVWLDFFERVQDQLKNIRSGDTLYVTPTADGCTDLHSGANGRIVLRFSKKFSEKLARKKASGYQPVFARVNFALWWKKADATNKTHQDRACKIILPEILLRKEQGERKIK